jgi:hypothetical protein
MKTIRAVMAIFLVALPISAQPTRRPIRPGFRPDVAEQAIKQAMEQLGNERKAFERDLEILKQLRLGDTALTDPMQPGVAISKAQDAVGKAKQLGPDPTVIQDVIRAERELEAAERSPGSADFGRLRTFVRAAVTSESRVVVRNALRLQEETLAWLRIQQLIAEHVRVLSEITGDSLRAAEQ